MATFKATKDPNAVLDYEIDWGTNYLEVGETISTSTWIADSGITVDSNTKTSTTATVWLSGGTAGTAYNVTNRIVTSASRTDDRTIKISVSNK